jgi:putative colanic acid biosynthesis acetyltransferase WcaF
MARKAQYNAAESITTGNADAYLRPAFPRRIRMKRLAWNVVWTLLYRFSPRPLHGWRTMLLRAFGATMGPHCHFYPKSKVWAPWNLICEDQVTAADGAEIYNPSPMSFGSHAILSQDSYICGATHDHDDPAFPLIAYAMRVGAYSWVCARASVVPGVNVGDGAVLGLGSVATRDLEPWAVYAGVPAVKVKERVRHEVAGA